MTPQPAPLPAADGGPLRLGVIASMKRGLEQFIYRELCHLENAGVAIHLYPTKRGPGLYGPRDSWHVQSWSPWGVLFWQPLLFLRQPFAYAAALATAVRHGAIVDFLIAACFSRGMRQLDAIYCTFGDRKLFVGYFVKRLLGKPLLCTVHAYELYQNPNPGLFRVAIAACDQLITISPYNREQIHARFGYDRDRIEVISYSIDLNEYQPRERFVILIVGFFVQRKGHDVLFRAVKQLNDPCLEVWVVGGPGAEAEAVDVRGLARKHGLEAQVAFFGPLSGTALRAVYHACDVFCLPCHFDDDGVGEGFPNVIIEAMACGKPVISTKHVAIPSILGRICVKEKDVNELAEAIQAVHASEQLRRELGVSNRELAEQHFSPRNAERTAAVVARLCRSGSRGRSEPKELDDSLADAPGTTDLAPSAAPARRAVTSCVLLGLVIGTLFSSSAKAQWLDQLPPNIRSSILWSADHEEGNLFDWQRFDGLDPGGGVLNTGERFVAAQATRIRAHSGKYSAVAVITGAVKAKRGDRAVRLMRWTDKPYDRGGVEFPKEAYYSTWMYIPRTYNPNKYGVWDPGDGGWWIVFQFKAHDADNVSQSMWGLNIKHLDATRQMAFYLYSPRNHPSSYEQPVPCPIPVGRWFHVEAFCKVSSTGNGRVTIWQDGLQILDANNVNTTIDSGPDNVVWGIGSYTNHIAGDFAEGAATVFFDDAAVSTRRVSQTLLGGGR